jgi:hypothetical protein
VQFRLTAALTERDALEHDLRIMTMEESQRPVQCRLGLNRDHARPEPAQARDTITDVRPNIEDQIARSNELREQGITPAAMIDPKAMMNRSRNAPFAA